MIDPGDWLPLAGVLLLAATTATGIGGAWAMGRARGMQDANAALRNEADTRARLERMERSIETVAHEMERLGEVQRFALKLVEDRALSQGGEPRLSPPPRVITPH